MSSELPYNEKKKTHIQNTGKLTIKSLPYKHEPQ